MDAALLGVAGVLSAIIVVTTLEVIYLAITVIILAVANFQGGKDSVTVAKAFRRALPAPLADAKIVGSKTAGGKPQFHRLI